MLAIPGCRMLIREYRGPTGSMRVMTHRNGWIDLRQKHWPEPNPKQTNLNPAVNPIVILPSPKPECTAWKAADRHWLTIPLSYRNAWRKVKKAPNASIYDHWLKFAIPHILRNMPAPCLIDESQGVRWGRLNCWTEQHANDPAWTHACPVPAVIDFNGCFWLAAAIFKGTGPGQWWAPDYYRYRIRLQAYDSPWPDATRYGWSAAPSLYEPTPPTTGWSPIFDETTDGYFVQHTAAPTAAVWVRVYLPARLPDGTPAPDPSYSTQRYSTIGPLPHGTNWHTWNRNYHSPRVISINPPDNFFTPPPPDGIYSWKSVDSPQ